MVFGESQVTVVLQFLRLCFRWLGFMSADSEFLRLWNLRFVVVISSISEDMKYTHSVRSKTWHTNDGLYYRNESLLYWQGLYETYTPYHQMNDIKGAESDSVPRGKVQRENFPLVREC